ncbi:MAG: ATP-binding cassette domain-containing protein, partial [Oscillospiraceae bacterium]|nr:ATP-binding cassette domain-containing protein [Oscillospiraceae bacterium]
MLELKYISKTFNPGTANERKAISDLSLTVPDCDFVSIIGSNGAGKSSVFNAIAGTFFTDSGSILLDGEDITL